MEEDYRARWMVAAQSIIACQCSLSVRAHKEEGTLKIYVTIWWGGLCFGGLFWFFCPYFF